MDAPSLGRGQLADERELLLSDSFANDDTPPTCRSCSPKTTSRIIGRIRALVRKLLEIQVDSEELRSPTSSIIPQEVIEAFANCAGDFNDAVPYCLLEAQRMFKRDARLEPADYDEHMSRALACEVLARKVVGTIPADRQYAVLSARYRRIESDGDVSLPLSVLESAVDQLCTVFLSSSETQRCISALWNGHLVQNIAEDGALTFQPYRNLDKSGFLLRLDPTRLAVPRFQNTARIVLWLVFLFAYTWALQTPDREFGVEDYVLYLQVLGYLLEDVTKIWKIFSIHAFTFWTCVNLLIWALALAAFGFRIADLASNDTDTENHYRYVAFQMLAVASPLIWMKLLTIFDSYSFFGTMQIVVARMLRESAVFFALLLLMSLGFMQALTGLDVADSARDSTVGVARTLFEALLGSPNFDLYDDNKEGVQFPAGLILYYAWSFVTIVVLLNVLIALFGSAYSDVTDSAIDMFLASWSGKVVAAVRAPDEFVYVAPFNLVELCILPLELIMSRQAYAKLNRALMMVLFSPFLAIIALYESRVDAKQIRQLRQRMIEDNAEDKQDENPEADDADDGKISKLSFDEVAKSFPDLTSSQSTAILREVVALRREVDKLRTTSPQSKHE